MKYGFFVRKIRRFSFTFRFKSFTVRKSDQTEAEDEKLVRHSVSFAVLPVALPSGCSSTIRRHVNCVLYEQTVIY